MADACRTGASTNIIFGLALGYQSCIIPTIILAIVIFVSFSLANMYGIACAALGMLGTLATGAPLGLLHADAAFWCAWPSARRSWHSSVKSCQLLASMCDLMAESLTREPVPVSALVRVAALWTRCSLMSAV